MYKLPTVVMIAALACSGSATAQPVRTYDDKGAPPFKVLKEGENPPLDAYDNFVIGPTYVPAPERKKVEGVPEGKVEQFEIDSKDTKLFNPGIKRDKFGTVDPKNPKTLIVETTTFDYKRKVGVYIPAQYKEGTEAPFMVVHDGPGHAGGYKTILDNLIHQKRIPPIILICIANGGGDAQGHERGKE
jgi:iron(III)-enterobactin esterase